MSKRLKALQDRKAALVKDMRSMLDAADAEGRDLTDEETEAYGRNETELAGVSSELEREERLQEIERSLQPVPDRNEETDEQRADRTGTQEPQGFGSLGEMLVAVYQAGTPGGRVDPRLTVGAAATGLSEGVPSDGGFLVQKDQASELLRRVYETGQLIGRTRQVPISANANGLKVNAIDETSRANGSRFGGVRGYWANEADEKTASKPKFRQMELDLKKLIGLCYATDELLQDATALESIIMQAFPEEFVFKAEDAMINGTGAGQPLGILNSGCLVSVAKETGQAAATIVPENIAKMWSRCWGRSRANAVWMINQDVEPQLHLMSLPVGTGGVPVYLPAGGLSQSPYATLYGRPVIPVEYCATIGTQGDILLGDWDQYLMIQKGGVQAASSIHVRFIYDETTFRFVWRLDGQPIWKSALTPYKGSNTLSPFVALDTRA